MIATPVKMSNLALLKMMLKQLIFNAKYLINSLIVSNFIV